MANFDLAKSLKRVCKYCGAPFSTHRSNRVYCQTECAYQSQLKRFRSPEYRAAERRRTAAKRTWVVLRPSTLPIRLDVNLPLDLSEWVQGVSKDRACSVSEVLRGAVRYAQEGNADLFPLRKHSAPTMRHARTHLTTRQGLFVDDLATEGRTRSHIMRSLLWRLRAAIDPPVSG